MCKGTLLQKHSIFWHPQTQLQVYPCVVIRNMASNSFTSEVEGIRGLIEEQWSKEVIPTLMDYIKVPNLSPFFDENVLTNGYMVSASQCFSSLSSANISLSPLNFCRKKPWTSSKPGWKSRTSAAWRWKWSPLQAGRVCRLF